MFNYSLSLLITFSSFLAFSQYWGVNTTSNFTNEAIDVETDAAGNQYVAGYITGETSFNVNTVQLSAAGNGDIYVAKYNSNGTLIWIKQFGGNYSDRPTDLVIGDANSIYITGQYFGQVNFGSFVLNSANTSKDIFLLKLNSIGDVVWAISEGANGNENAYGLATDSQNNLLLTGQFQGNSNIAGQVINSTINPLTMLPGYDMFISKYDQNGTPLWLKTGQAKYDDRGFAVHCDANDNIFLCGQFSDTLTFGGSVFNNNAYNVGFLCKLSPLGQIQWLNKLKAGMVMPYDLEVNNLNEVVVTGDFIGNLSYQQGSSVQSISNPYSKKIFLLKTSNSGNFIWGTSLGSNNDISARAISIDGAKNTYVTGYFKCDLSQIHDTNVAIFNSVGYKDIYLLKVDNNGNQTYIKQIGGKENDEGHGIAILPNSQATICGSFTQNLMFPYTQGAAYTTSNTNNFNLNIFSSDYYPPYNSISFHYLHGDLSRNSFLLNANIANSPDYNFFVNQASDSLLGTIAFGLDTMHFCEETVIQYEPMTYSNFGPAYNYLWNSGDTTQYLYINQTNDYSVIVERMDGCSAGEDTIFCIHHFLPPLPLLTDNLGIAVNAPGSNYQYYNFCAPDSVQIWFSNLCTNCSISINPLFATQNYTDTLPHFYSNDQTYPVQISDSFCTNSGYFTIDLDYVLPFDTIKPYHYFVEDYDFNDTITMCAEDELHVHIYDSITNPNAIYDQFNFQPLVDSNWTISPIIQGNWYYSHGYAYSYKPQNTGWYTFNYTATIGYDNLCGLDTLMYDITDSIYIIVNPLPSYSITIAGDNLLCPNGSAYLIASDTLPEFNWYGPGIAWQNANGDSIQITEAGNYYYAGVLIDTLTACSDTLTFIHLINLKQAPPILMNPEDGIVCPYDSVTMTINDIYVSYDWIGPDGFNISTTNIAIDAVQGFYYCHVEDTEGCILTTTPAEIREFTTPSLFVEPTNVLCPGESVTISVTYDGNAQIQWTSPIVSNADQIIVNQVGYYVCEIQQCNMTFMDSVEILDGSFQVFLTTSDSVLCFNETAILTATSGYSEYEWSNGVYGSSVLTSTDPGNYFVTVTNQYGCIANSNTIYVEAVVESVPPDLIDLIICSGSDAILSEVSGASLNWYSSDSLFIQNSSTFSILNIENDTSVLAAFEIPSCSPVYGVINITLVDSLPDLQILGDPFLCPNELTIFSVSTNSETVNWYENGVLLNSGDTLEYQASSSGNNNITAIVSNTCYSDTLSLQISIFTPEIISLELDSLILCNYSIVPIGVIGNYDTLIWTTPIGTFTGDTLYASTQLGNSLIEAQGIDINGCLTNIATIQLLSSSLTYELYQLVGNNCANDTIVIGVNSSTDSLLWTTPNGFTDSLEISFVLNNSTSGWYSIQLWDESACVYQDSIFVSPNQIPTFSLTNDSIACLNDWLNINTISDSISYYWEGFGVVDSVPIQNNNWYIVTATSQYGCTYTDSVFIMAIDCDNELPNVITANGDGINDYFIIDEASIFKNNQLIIINRWGNVMFEMDAYDNSFNGIDVSDGVYYYVFIYDTRIQNGQQKKGFLHIIK